LDEKCKKLEETIQRVATNTIGYTRKQANNEWFDEECAEVNEEKNAARERAIHQNNTTGGKNAYKLARTKERRLFRKKARQLDEEALIESERHRRTQDSRKFYKRLNDVRPFDPQVAMCRAKNGELLTNQNQVLARWKEHFEEHLNEGSESEQPTRPVDWRDDGVDIDLPSREEIEGALKYLKNNKTAGAILSRPSC
jgi:hypothetical protein